jgi:hypothetical protein
LFSLSLCLSVCLSLCIFLNIYLLIHFLTSLFRTRICFGITLFLFSGTSLIHVFLYASKSTPSFSISHFLFFSLSVLLSLCIFISLSLSYCLLSFCLSVSLSSLCLSGSLSIWLSVYLALCLSGSLSIWLSVSLFLCLSASLFLILFTCIAH